MAQGRFQAELPEGNGLFVRWSRPSGIDVDVLVGEHGEHAPPPMVMDRPAVVLLEVGRARVRTRAGERGITRGTCRTLLPGEANCTWPLSPYSRFVMALLPDPGGDDGLLGAFAGDLPAIVESPGLAAAMLALKEVAVCHPKD